jgi:hypothetical protein
MVSCVTASRVAIGKPSFLVLGITNGGTWLSRCRGRGPGAIHDGSVDPSCSHRPRVKPGAVATGSGCHVENIRGAFEDVPSSRYIPLGKVSISTSVSRSWPLNHGFVRLTNLEFHPPPNSSLNLEWIERACGLQKSWKGTVTGDCRSFAQIVRTKPAPTIMVPPCPN